MVRRVQARIAAFLLVAAALQVSPFVVQVLGIRKIPLVMGWRMYRYRGSEICDVRYEARTSPDAAIRVLRLAELGTSKPTQRIRRVARARSLGRAFCQRLPAGTDVRVFARCGHPTRGWKSALNGEENLCSTVE